MTSCALTPAISAHFSADQPKRSTRWADYDTALDSLEAAGQSYGIKNTATALMIVLEVFSRHLTDLQDGFLDADQQPKDPSATFP